MPSSQVARISVLLRYIIYAAFLVEGFVGLVSIIDASSAKIRIGSATALAVLLCLAIVAVARFLPSGLLAEDPVKRLPALVGAIVCLGLLLRIGWLVAVPPIQTSDYLRYMTVTRNLLSTGKYMEFRPDATFRAFTPPGLPFFIAAGLRIFGDRSWTPAWLNLGLYLATSLLLFKLAAQLVNQSVALLTILLFAIWPSEIALTGLAASEPLFLFLMLGACYFALVPRPFPWRFIVLCGFSAGLATLARPTALTLPALWAAAALTYGAGAGRKLKEAALASACLLLTVAPWTIRNYRELGALVPVSTNGGDVFYRANNPWATGTWTARGARDLSMYISDEVRWNRVGFAWGKEWIKSNPVAFLKLAVRKQFMFLSSDETGTYWALARGFPERTTEYALASAISNIWWFLLWILCLFSVVRYWKHLLQTPQLICLILPFLYFLEIHSIFESQSRYHIPAVPFLLILAAVGLGRYSVNEQLLTFRHEVKRTI